MTIEVVLTELITAILKFCHVKALYTNTVTRKAYSCPKAHDSVTVKIHDNTPPTIITAVNSPGSAVTKCKNRA